MEATKALDFPAIEATTHPDGSGQIVVQGSATQIDGTDAEATRSRIVEIAAEQAGALGRPVKMTTHGTEGSFRVIVDQDGTVQEDVNAPKVPQPRRAAPEQAPEAAPAAPAVRAVEPVEQDTEAAPAAAPDAWVREGTPTPRTRREARHSFLATETVEKPASKGFRGLVTRAGIRMSPGKAESEERLDVRAVSQHWAGPRTIEVVNGKGGIGKTMNTINLAATFARFGGAGVLAWDNNQTRGTLGWSTEQGDHESTILDLLPQAEKFLGPTAQGSDLAHYVHHQTTDKFDVLRSKPEVLATEQRFDGETVTQIHRVATKFYRLVFIDSGNDETDPMWVRATELSNQLVVPTIVTDKSAESANLLLESLEAQGGKFAELAANAVVVVSRQKSDVPESEVSGMVSNFESLAREVVTIPYDPALGAGKLSYDAMRPQTQRAWLRAAAAVARGL